MICSMEKLGFRAFVFYTIKEKSKLYDSVDAIVDELYLPGEDALDLTKSDILNISLRVEDNIHCTKIPKDLKRKHWQLTVDQKHFPFDKNWEVIDSSVMQTNIVNVMDSLERTLFSGDQKPLYLNRVVVEDFRIGQMDYGDTKRDLVNVYFPLTLSTDDEKNWNFLQEWMRTNLKTVLGVVVIDDGKRSQSLEYGKYEPLLM